MICLVLVIFASIFHTGWMTTLEEEQTLVLVQPEGVQRRLVGEIIQRFERKGFKLMGLKMMPASRELLEKYFEELKAKPFFPGLIQYMTSGPVVAMVWQGLGVVRTTRAMIGATIPTESAPGTIRGDYAIQASRNVVHGSDSVERAEREIERWFKNEANNDWFDSSHQWMYE